MTLRRRDRQRRMRRMSRRATKTSAAENSHSYGKSRRSRAVSLCVLLQRAIRRDAGNGASFLYTWRRMRYRRRCMPAWTSPWLSERLSGALCLLERNFPDRRGRECDRCHEPVVQVPRRALVTIKSFVFQTSRCIARLCRDRAAARRYSCTYSLLVRALPRILREIRRGLSGVSLSTGTGVTGRCILPTVKNAQDAVRLQPVHCA